MKPNSLLMLLSVALAAAALTPTTTRADERLFTYSYQATTIPKGKGELETWVTYKHSTPEDSTYKKVQVRHEIEFGLTDNIQLDLYFADWSWSDPGRGSTGKFNFDDVAATLKINYLNPGSDAIGLASYHEVKFGEEIFELENKLLLQKNLGKFVFVYNFTLEAEWEGHAYHERGGEISQSFGGSYEITPSFFLGAEALHEIPLPDWETGADQNFFLGPVASYRFGGESEWFITATALRQLTNTADEAEWQFRMIFGFSF